MSIWYDLYLEGCVDGEWRAIGPYLKKADGTVHLATIDEGQSVVGAMLESVNCHWGVPDDISDDVLTELLSCESTFSDYYDEAETISIEEAHAKWFCLSDIQVDPARFEYEAYVAREDMRAFERGEIQEIEEWFTPEEYGSLPDDRKRFYTYFRWTEPYGSYNGLCRLKALAQGLLGIYRDNVLRFEKGRKEITAARIIVSIG